jgi:hypothetical protein
MNFMVPKKEFHVLAPKCQLMLVMDFVEYDHCLNVLSINIGQGWDDSIGLFFKLNVPHSTYENFYVLVRKI